MDTLPVNLPGYYKTTFSSLPAVADKPGQLYFVEDDNGVPVGIAVSGNDKRIRFYSIMENTSGTSTETAERTPSTARYDELAGSPGVSNAVSFNADGSIDEVVTSPLGIRLAGRSASFSTGGIVETYTFYQADGMTADYQIVVTTELSDNEISISVT